MYWSRGSSAAPCYMFGTINSLCPRREPCECFFQVDWRLIKQGDGARLWRAQVPGTVWCMIRTRAAVPASPQTVLDFLLDESCIPKYDELFDKIEVVEPVDDVSIFKRT